MKNRLSAGKKHCIDDFMLIRCCAKESKEVCKREGRCKSVAGIVCGHSCYLPRWPCSSDCKGRFSSVPCYEALSCTGVHDSRSFFCRVFRSPLKVFVNLLTPTWWLPVDPWSLKLLMQMTWKCLKLKIYLHLCMFSIPAMHTVLYCSIYIAFGLYVCIVLDPNVNEKLFFFLLMWIQAVDIKESI